MSVSGVKDGLNTMAVHPATPNEQPDAMSGKSQYMVQLDALRAFAVFAVLFHHFHGKVAAGRIEVGTFGVKLFFVLSGFLITGILLGCRDIKEGSTSKTHALKQFYIRRSLRIFPLFYLVLFVTALGNINPVRETFWWHLTYASNIYFALRGDWYGPVSHFWTLAVEEQFYLVWPFLILFLPNKYLLPGIVTAIALAPVYQIAGHFLHFNHVALSVITVACLEYLAMGALLAYFRYSRPRQFQDLAQHPGYRWLGLPLLALLVVITIGTTNFFVLEVIGGLITTCLFAWLIHRTSIGFGGVAGRVLEWRPILFIGRISYGIYVYHNFMYVITARVFRTLHLPWPDDVNVRFLLLTAVTLMVATCSWFCFERPINNLKHKFRYSRG